MRKIFIPAVLGLAIIFSCSDPVEIEISKTNILAAYPNPMRDRGLINVNNSTGESATLVVFDPAGEVILDMTLPPGSHQLGIDVTNKPGGKFQIICKVGATTYTKDLLKI
ncbi:T9SS type A sorting domain-containing protein [Chryseolinea sp. H1M3-3]|uniref:T9SS type A sorting domain-containing protein n=1 Tax=Chryseolinea sp. H1M3-3 TaxID=3034144 RepID=UPI0023EE157D|nr:T9SS type A sorting domain-containing protein [Chryseolinea sp. H1M3-3]